MTYPTRNFNPPRAVIAPYQDPVTRSAKQVAIASNTLYRTTFQRPAANDYALANTDDVLKKGGSFLIASLATLGAATKIIGISEFIGFGSWFAAMALTPKVINALVKFRTGVDPGWEYISSQGERKRLLQDSQYLPLNVLPDDVINRAGDKLNIPKNIPNRRQKVEEKIQQIATQTNTWWMLVAGPATPVLSGLICDTLIDPVTRLVNRTRGDILKSRLGDNIAQASTQSVKEYVDHLAGETLNSQLSHWWRNFGAGLIKDTGMNKAFLPLDAFPSAESSFISNLYRQIAGKPGRPHSQQELLERMVDHFHALSGNTDQLNRFKEYLNNQSQTLKTLQQEVNTLVTPHKEKLGSELVEGLEARFSSAGQTIENLQKLANELLKGGSNITKQDVAQRLDSMVIGAINDFDERGLVKTVEKLLGPNYRRIQQKMWQGQFANAVKELGAPPAGFLKTALQDFMAHRLWQTRVIGLLGGSLLALTSLYTLLFVGKGQDGPPKPDKHRHIGPPWMTDAFVNKFMVNSSMEKGSARIPLPQQPQLPGPQFPGRTQ